MRTYRTALAGFLVIALGSVPGSSLAQPDNHRAALRLWAQGQRSVMGQIENMGVQTTVHHAIETRNGRRVANIRLSYDGRVDEPRKRPTVLEFVLNSDTLDTSERNRAQRSLMSIMSPGLGPMLFGYVIPISVFDNMRMVEEPFEEEVEGETLIHFNFITRGPGLRQGNRGARMPPGRGGRRPGFGRRPSPGMRTGQNGWEAPVERITYWFDEDIERLIMSFSVVTFPGNRSLEAQTSYERIEGLDVPVWRTIEGTFAMQRRLRTITVRLKHESTFSNYTFQRP